MRVVESNIKLISKTGEPRRVLYTAIRTAYSPLRPLDLFEFGIAEGESKQAKDGKVGTEVDRLLRHVVKNGHTSTLEHVNFTYAVSGVSRSLLAQLTRHRMGVSLTVQSQRYVDDKKEGKKGGFSTVTPESINNNPYAYMAYWKAINTIQETYDELRQHGITKEDARYILPNAATTNITLTMNLRALLHFYKLRTDKGAQQEIRGLAEALKNESIQAEPWLESLFEEI